jgi:hypothetical protein
VIRRLLVFACALALPLGLRADQALVQVEPPSLQGSRPLEPLTASSVVRDYLQSWTAFRTALSQNQPQLLSQDFVGIALTKLSHTIAEQNKLGLHTRYVDRSHHLRIVFYSPDGLSIQLVDHVVYDEQVLEGATILATQPVHARYLVVLTPSQTRWQVRFFQATTE